MGRMIEASQVALAIVRVRPGWTAVDLRQAKASILHQLPFQPPDPDGGYPAVQMLNAASTDHERFMITCLQLPGVVLFGETEEEVLTLAQLAIERAIVARAFGHS